MYTKTEESAADLHRVPQSTARWYSQFSIERLQGVWPKIIPVAMEMPIFHVNFSSLNCQNLNDESLGPHG